MKPSERGAGMLAMTGAALSLLYCGRVLIHGLATGMVKGRQGAIHLAPSHAYWAGIVAAVVGLVLALVVGWMGWRWFSPKS